MTGFSRRDMIKMFGLLGASTLIGPSLSAAESKARIVVVGGGFGGVTAARFLKRYAPGLDVTLVEPSSEYISCPFSNLVVAGHRDLQQQIFSYQAVARTGVRVVQDVATGIDPDKKQVFLRSGNPLAYDRLVLSPGIDFRWNALAGYTAESVERMPHAWKAGPQTLLLRDQLRQMPEDGVVVMSIPGAPFRCPPGPYERASLIADYLQREKPSAKLILLDSNLKFSKQPLFEQIWQEQYAGVIERRDPVSDGVVREVDANTMTVHMDFESVKADVANIIPPQQAGAIAREVGAADTSGWCPINATSFESTLVPDVHVIGDATIASPMPKSAFSANAQAKVCALQMLRLLADLPPQSTTLLNTCYSFVNQVQAISVSGVYHNPQGQFESVPSAGGISPADGGESLRETEGQHANDWFRAITLEAFG